MKKAILFVLIFAFLSSTSLMADENGFYISGNIGVSILNNVKFTHTQNYTGRLFHYTFNINPGFSIFEAIGYRIQNWRFEIELNFHKNTIDNISESDFEAIGNFSIFKGMLNANYHINNDSRFSPYFFTGVGFTMVSANKVGFKVKDPFNVNRFITVHLITKDETVYGIQFGTGLNYQINNLLTLDIKYHYYMTSNPKMDNDTEIKIGGHIISTGIIIYL